MSSCPALSTTRQLTDRLDIPHEELCTPERLPSLPDAVRAVPDPRTSHLLTRAWPMLLGLVACAMLCGACSVPPHLGDARGALPEADRDGQPAGRGTIKNPTSLPGNPGIPTSADRHDQTRTGISCTFTLRTRAPAAPPGRPEPGGPEPCASVLPAGP